jgi:hypothetical protein
MLDVECRRSTQPFSRFSGGRVLTVRQATGSIASDYTPLNPAQQEAEHNNQDDYRQPSDGRGVECGGTWTARTCKSPPGTRKHNYDTKDIEWRHVTMLMSPESIPRDVVPFMIHLN